MLKDGRVLEWFAGIGGAAAAFDRIATVVAAIDINLIAKRTYQSNFSHPYLTRTIESFSTTEVDAFQANIWWLSPPCQPFTRRGNKRDLHDRRCEALHHILNLLPQVRPEWIFFENVVGFETSQMRDCLRDSLVADYEFRECRLCPTELGVPNHRPRYYLVARLKTEGGVLPLSVSPPIKTTNHPSQIDGYLSDPSSLAIPACQLSEAEMDRFGAGLNVVEATENRSNCFTSGYGKSIMYSGSYLACQNGRPRRFLPEEILRFLGFPKSYTFPQGISDRQAWRLAGNSISVFAARRLIESQLSAI